MTLNKNLTADWYYVDGGDAEKNIKCRMEDSYTQASTINLSFWQEADTDIRFAAGDQTIWNDYYGNLPAFRRQQFNFNNIRRIKNLITGYQRRNRKSLVTHPVHSNDEPASDQYTKLLYATSNKANLYEKISEAFDKGTVTTGLSLLKFYLDYSKDPESGDIKAEHVFYNAILIDPYFKNFDLSDCNFIWQRQWLTPDYAKLLLPGREDEISRMRPSGNKDGKFQFMAESYYYGMQNLLIYDEYYYRTLRKTKILVDPETRLTKEWHGTREDLKRFLDFFPQIIVKETLVPTVKLAISVDDKIMYDGPVASGLDRFPFAAFLGYYEPEIPYFPWRCQGVVRGLRDAQFLYNRRKVIELDILESQANSGHYYKPTSLVNPSDIYLEGQGRGIAIKQNAEMTDIQKIPPPDIPQGMLQISEIMKREMMEISGVNEELLGSAEDDKAGILSMLRQGAGLTTLQVLFDHLDFATIECGKIMLEIIQKNFSEGKLADILEEEPSPEFSSKVFPEYDIRVEEGSYTTTQKKAAFIEKFELYKAGVPIPVEDLLQEATFQNKKETMEKIQAQQQQQEQMQQEQAMQQMELLKAEIENLKARAVADQGLGVERISRVEENRAFAVERIADAQESRLKGSLDYVKALKELQDIDLNQIQKLITIANMIKEQAVQPDRENQEERNETGIGSLSRLG